MSDIGAEIKEIEKALNNICDDWVGIGIQINAARQALLELKRLAPEQTCKKYANQKTPCTDECYVRISDLKQAILENPYDPAKGEISSYLRYLKYNTPIRTNAWKENEK